MGFAEAGGQIQRTEDQSEPDKSCLVQNSADWVADVQIELVSAETLKKWQGFSFSSNNGRHVVRSQ